MSVVVVVKQKRERERVAVILNLSWSAVEHVWLEYVVKV